MVTEPDTGTETARRGRPRSAESERAILNATLDLLAEGHGPATISIGTIAKRAGAGKDTIYRRWTSKEALLLDALRSRGEPIEVPDDASLRDALTAVLAELILRMQSDRDRRILRSLQSADDGFAALRARHYEQVISRRRDVIVRHIAFAAQRGELRDDIDVSAIALMPFHHAVMSALEDAPIGGDPETSAGAIIDALLHGIARPGADKS
jgi:AcrR family transcriptional regulator